MSPFENTLGKVYFFLYNFLFSKEVVENLPKIYENSRFCFQSECKKKIISCTVLCAMLHSIFW